ncbi:MAG: hypothetical protein DBX59_02645 [Bacillota bacterium]|nr:MAG: hypothetical protein DBX59_02645 [Bacillota bacterium]
MDARITKRRLSEMLQYDWVKIIGMVIVAIVVWELIFTVSAVRVKTGQNFKVYYYPTAAGASGLYEFNDEKQPLSYDVLEFSIETLTTDYADTILNTRLSIGEGDLIVVDNEISYPDDHKDDAMYAKSNLYNVVDNYTVAPLDVLNENAKNYLARFMENGEYEEDGSFLADKVEENFVTRMKGDNRFRKEENRAKGVAWEIERLESLRAATKEFSYLLDTVPELFLTYTKYQSAAHNRPSEDIQAAYEKQQSHPYALDVEYLSQHQKEGVQVIDIANNCASEANWGTSKDVAVAAFDFTADQPDLQYEIIVFLTALVRNYSTLLDSMPV